MSNITITTMAQSKRQKVKVNYVLFFSCYFLFLLLFLTGCGPEQQAADLYVDAVMLSESGEDKEAVEKLDSAVKLNKDFSPAYSLLGEIYEKMQDYEKSAASYNEATRVNPWSFDDYFSLGRVYRIMKKFAQAVKTYVRACELKPNHLEAHVNAAKSYYEIEDFNNALVYGRRAEEIEPDIVEIQKLLGDIYESKKDHEKAIGSYKRALEADSENPEIMTSLAVAYLRTNRNEPAKELLTAAIKNKPDNGTAYHYLGYYYLRLYDENFKAYKDLKQAGGEDLELKASLDESLEKALANCGKAIEIDQMDWYAHKVLGVAYMLKLHNSRDESLKAKAVEQWRLSLEIKPDQPNYEGLARLIEKHSN
jgi:tetratricopeptide (TPR) repeat protein